MVERKMKLILASQSPRRAQLLTEAGFEFTVFAPDDWVEENANKNLPPGELVVELACLKAQNVAGRIGQTITRSHPTPCLVLAADTVAHCHGEVLGKPADRVDARRMLQLMSGQTHEVLTGVCLWEVRSRRQQAYLETTTLRMDELNEQQLDAFLDTDGWRGKAGGFGYQDGLDWVHIETGLASNVVGLPIEKLLSWIQEIEVERFGDN